MHGKTPLQLAEIPHMDRIARQGVAGLFETIPPGLANGSATANLGVMGYDARELFGDKEGRGVLEAASMGIELKPGQLAMRVNVISTDNGRIKNHSAGHITTEEVRELFAGLDEKIGLPGVRLYPGISYRNLIVVDGGDERLDCAPPHDNVGGRLDDLLPHPEVAEANPTAALLEEVVRRSQPILAEHPVNQRRRAAGKATADSLWPWAPGMKPKMKTYQEMYGVTGAVISSVDLIRGIGVYAGLETVIVPGATGLWDTNYEGKAEAAIEALKRLDFVYIHMEGPDEAGHEKQPWLKLKCLEWIDQRVVRTLMMRFDQTGEPVVYAVLPDHPTPCETGAHVTEPVPVAICGPGIQPDACTGYDEQQVKLGSLGVLKGRQFMDYVMGKK
jgi:2,3-bisphosphoglycerate-independent phosphoglycerate mutase